MYPQLCLTLCDPMNCSSARPLCPWDFSGKSGLRFPSPGDLLDPGIEPESPVLAGGFFTTSATWEAQLYRCHLRRNVVTTKKIQIMFRIEKQPEIISEQI